MNNRNLTEKIKAEVLNNGMDLVGFAPVSRWKNAPFLLSPQAILPESKTVVVAAIHITDTWTEMGGTPEPQDKSPGGWMDQNSLMDRIAYKTVRMLNDYGHKAIAIASSNIWRYRQYEGIPSIFAPDLSHIHAAAAAGLAEIGWSGLAITPEFGSRCRFISIVTDAELTPTPMYNGPKLCDMCMDCVRHCPTASLRKELKEPHEIEIGGKTFRYANKNMWRCAWAEHFNLDLNSENLKKMDHVGEKEILDELDKNGIRGHERGVCQKVCVPPHLRSKKPSFGRDNQISQNRINQRYPDSMPTLRKMRDDITAFVVKQGVDLVSVGALDLKSEAGKAAFEEAPGTKTVVALAFRIPNEVNEGEYNAENHGVLWGAIYLKMHHILLRTARLIEDYGYHAASYTSRSINANQLPEQLSAMTDLGEIDSDGIFLTPELGSNVAIGVVTTDAPIDHSIKNPDGMVFESKRKIIGKELRFELEALARKNLVSFMGVAKAEIFDTVVTDLKKEIDESELGLRVGDSNHNPHGKFVPVIENDNTTIRRPEDYVPNAKSVIVLGMHFPQEVIDNAGLPETQQIGTYAFHQYQTFFELRFVAFELAKLLSEMGGKVMISEDMLGIGSLVDSPRGKLPDARCNAVEAVAAGLGEIGKSGALLTSEYGPHQRRIVIITDVELPYDTPGKSSKVCHDCEICASRCPMQVIKSESVSVRLDDTVIELPKIERLRCDWSKRYSLCPEEGPGLIGNNTDVKPPEGKMTIENIAEACTQKDPVMKNRTCVLETCLRVCPAGRKSK